MLIAPATANFIGKMANGIADDLLSTIVLTLEAPILIAPSMNPRMYNNPAVVRNLDVLRERGIPVLEPGMGELACGEEGVGRMAEVDEILRLVRNLLKPEGPLSGKRVLVTAGPTVEPIDPVRYISNRSSGKMGYALALEAHRMGAAVTLVSGPTALAPPGGVKCLSVHTALEMHKAVESEFQNTDVLIMAAAVGDYRVEASYSEKIKKGSKPLSLPLVLNPDILNGLAAARRKGQVLVGFAAETENLKEEATRKLHEKGLDFIVANDISENGTGFGSDKNRVMILDRKGVVEETDVLPKREIARKILSRVLNEVL
jgi:phosphopantothenoylcysteine decarboxylase/phosphopantothenate--cysteine ligase